MSSLPEAETLDQLTRYVSQASVSTDPLAAAGMEGARQFVDSTLCELGFLVSTFETDLHPILLGTLNEERKEWPHLLIYAHYDVQPASPEALWTSPPFQPEVRNGRLYGRGSADNKGPFMVHVAALQRLKRKWGTIPLRITWLIEGEEEIGSPSFKKFLEENRDRLRAEMLFLCDTGSPSSEQIAITTGLRGLVGCHVELRGPKMDLHSGIHGGALLNPIEGLMRVCGSLINSDGRVTVEGFYDEVLDPTDWERAELAKTGQSEESYREFLGVNQLRPVPGYTALESLRFAPTLEFNGIGGGFQGEGTKTVIPSVAFAKITCRLVADQDPGIILERLKKALRQACPEELEMTIHSHGEGWPYRVVPPGLPNTPPDQSPTLAAAFRAADRWIEKAFGKAPVYLREGGSVPIIGDLQRICGVDSLMIGLFTAKDNLHAPDESFDLALMAKAIDAFEGIFSDLIV
ncbi:MAG: M20/M25/M40 family metallo-hydrolase [Puniceicoccaceae bacterium]